MPIIASIPQGRPGTVAGHKVDGWCKLDAVEEAVSFELRCSCLLLRNGRVLAQASPCAIDRERGELALRLEPLSADGSPVELQPGDRLVSTSARSR